MTQENAVKRAVKAAGGAAVVASLFEISPVSVYEWINSGRVPAERCPALERAGKSVVRCEELRPDVDWAYLREHVVPETAAAA